MADDRPTQRRPDQGIRWVRDEAFVERLTALIDGGKKSHEVAREVSASWGYEVDDSLIRKLKTAPYEEMPSSHAIGPICLHYGWPVPPAVDPDHEFADEVSAMYELKKRDPVQWAKVLKFTRSALDAARQEDELSRGTPEDS